MNEAALALGNIFLAEKKSDVEKLCRAALIDEGTLSKFIHLCQCGLLPWNGNPPLNHCSEKKSYAAMASRCFGVMPPNAIFGRSWLYRHIHCVA